MNNKRKMKKKKRWGSKTCPWDRICPWVIFSTYIQSPGYCFLSFFFKQASYLTFKTTHRGSYCFHLTDKETETRVVMWQGQDYTARKLRTQIGSQGSDCRALALIIKPSLLQTWPPHCPVVPKVWSHDHDHAGKNTEKASDHGSRGKFFTFFFVFLIQ
jgi:hypothetical protein